MKMIATTMGMQHSTIIQPWLRWFRWPPWETGPDGIGDGDNSEASASSFIGRNRGANAEHGPTAHTTGSSPSNP